MYSSVVRTDWDVSLGLFRALIAACESDNILMYLMFISFKLANAYWQAWLMASISAWNTVDVSGICIFPDSTRRGNKWKTGTQRRLQVALTFIPFS